MQATVDQNICIGCGTCMALCPQVFEIGESGKAQVKKEADFQLPCVDEAKESCPVSAITVE